MEIAIVYMVAGLSSRFKGNLDHKGFVEIGPNGESLIEYSLSQALGAGFNKIVFIVGNKTERAFREKFGESYKGIPVHYAFQEHDVVVRDRPWGTLDAVCCAKELLDCPFVVCNGDDIYGKSTFKKLFEHLRDNNGNVTIGYKIGEVLPDQGSVNRGVFGVDGNKVNSIKEVFDIEKDRLSEKGLDESGLCSMNIWGFHPEALELLHEVLDEFKIKHNGNRKIESLLPTEIGKLIEDKKIEVVIYPAEDKWLGITYPEDVDVVRGMLKED
jgi:NDP-sugar pyrophosphorylase family protein